jgi:hypothetical protein
LEYRFSANSKRAREAAAIDQDILAVDVARMLATEKGAEFAKFFGLA